ncbi:sulfate adenylyltransferase subunit CysD [Amphritea sp. 1_MG-2023]|uniref:sulfate adenylyltransferase subunit CysD n=1 Tax=Amphritea sp. 1_MG-2023 TaxID=3062670 RepID=UPI0034A5226D
MNGKKLAPTALNKLRKEAVQLRLSGETLASIKQQTGLSHPTIISAYKCFIEGGWEAVNTGKRGRPKTVAPSGLGSPDECLTFMLANLPDNNGLWHNQAVQAWFNHHQQPPSLKTINRYLNAWGITAASTGPKLTPPSWLAQHHPEQLSTYHPLSDNADAATHTKHLGITKPQQANSLKLKVIKGGIGQLSLTAAQKTAGLDGYFIYAQDFRGKRYWLMTRNQPDSQDIIHFLERLSNQLTSNLLLSFHSVSLDRFTDIQQWLANQTQITLLTYATSKSSTPLAPLPSAAEQQSTQSYVRNTMALTHLQRLEAESIQIMREVVSKADNPVMLYSIGKDSAVMLHLAMKAFHPSKPPFPLLHVDTGWKFREMYTFRDELVKNLGVELITYMNPEGIEKGINPFTHGSALHTDIMKTEGLKQALNKFKFDVAFGGARRDEEKSRAKERIFSFRTADHRWDPKNQRPELWKNYNANKRPGESIRVFPLSNWTELDIWQYIYLEQIPIVPLYLSAERPVVERDGTLIMVDDERMPLQPNEVPMMKSVRFRTLGCYPLTGAVESEADTLPAIIQEMLLTKTSERQGRMIDHDSAASMEKKKQEGYF